MKPLENIICALVLMATAATFAQQNPNRTFYRYHMNLINPAYAGSTSTDSDSYNDKIFDANSEFAIDFRSQWSGVDGAPESQTALYSTGLRKNIGLGVSIINDRTFIEQQTSVALDVSYRLKAGDRTYLYLGIKAGATYYNANTDGLITFGITEDPSLVNIEGGFQPAIGAGALLKGEKFFLAFSIPNLTSTERLEQNNGEVKLGDSRQQMYLAGGYDIALGHNLIFRPAAMANYVAAAPLSLDVTAALSFNRRVELGASYRFSEGIGGFMIFNASNWVAFGYAYEAPFENPVQIGSNGTHEVFMKFKM